MNPIISQIIALLTSAIAFGTVIMYGSLGETLTEKSGNLNLGVPGIMYLGGIGGLIGAFFYEMYSAAPVPVVGMLIAVVCCIAGSLFGGLIYSFLTISLRANQNVTGLALTIFGSGVANFFGGSLSSLAGGVGQISIETTSSVFRATQHLTDKIPYFDDIFCNFGFMVYLAPIIAIVMNFIFTKTSVGLNIRAVGEKPATADAAGINVTKYKYLSTCIGAVISGLGGLYYVADYSCGKWDNGGNIEALGWLAVALVIFATWKPLRSIWGAYLFGLLYWVYNYITMLFLPSSSVIELIKMLPYVVTVLVLISVSLRRKREDQPPSSLGLSYFREDR
ncbi:MAG: ABC transporter permease [Clostridia bacterium]|nr:ABC transporter permease [Clostridia bacterium]